MRDLFAHAAALEGVPSAVAAARDGIDAVLRDRGPRGRSPAATAESLLRGAVASARLDGSESSLEQVRDGTGDPVARASVALSAQLLSLVPVWRSVPLQALARLHTVAAAGLVSPERLGRPDPGRPGTAERLRDLAYRLLAPTSASALVVAALVHAEVAGTRPFGSLDGLVARAAERLVLVSSGLDPTALTVPELGHLSAGDGYAVALEAYRSGGDAGLRRWLLHAAGAYTEGARRAPD